METSEVEEECFLGTLCCPRCQECIGEIADLECPLVVCENCGSPTQVCPNCLVGMQLLCWGECGVLYPKQTWGVSFVAEEGPETKYIGPGTTFLWQCADCSLVQYSGMAVEEPLGEEDCPAEEPANN